MQGIFLPRLIWIQVHRITYNNSIFITEAGYLAFSMYFLKHLCIAFNAFKKCVIIANRKTKQKFKTQETKTKLDETDI